PPRRPAPAAPREIASKSGRDRRRGVGWRREKESSVVAIGSGLRWIAAGNVALRPVAKGCKRCVSCESVDVLYPLFFGSGVDLGCGYVLTMSCGPLDSIIWVIRESSKRFFPTLPHS